MVQKSLPPSSPRLSLLCGLLDPLQRPHLLPHPSINNLVFTLDTSRSSLNTLVRTLGNDNLLLLQLVLAMRLAHDLSDLSSLLGVVQVFRLHHTVGLLLGLFNTLNRLELLTSLGLGNLLDGSSVQSSLSFFERGNSFFGDRDVGLVELGFIVQEPGRETVFVESGESVETVVDKSVRGDFTVDQLRSQCNSFGGQ